MFALVDCNNFFVSCERLHRPELCGKPVVVLSNNDGVVVSRSNEAKALGIPMGAPYFKYEKHMRAAGVHVFSGNHRLYIEISKQIMHTLDRFSPLVEAYSIDEAFICLKGFGYKNLTEYGREMYHSVLEQTGIPISIGIASTKTLAKAAARQAKRDPSLKNVMLIDSKQAREQLLLDTPIAKVWGIGGRLAERMYILGISNAKHLADRPSQWVRKTFNVCVSQTANELRGIPCFGIQQERPLHKSIICSSSFGQRLTELRDLHEAIANFASRAAEKLRREQQVARFISVYVKSSRFNKTEPYYTCQADLTLPYATHDTAQLISHAKAGITGTYRPGVRYKKCGIMLTGLSPYNHLQEDLFGQRNSQQRSKEHARMQALDTLNKRFGRDTVYFAAQSDRGTWHPNAIRQSNSHLEGDDIFSVRF